MSGTKIIELSKHIHDLGLHYSACLREARERELTRAYARKHSNYASLSEYKREIAPIQLAAYSVLCATSLVQGWNVILISEVRSVAVGKLTSRVRRQRSPTSGDMSLVAVHAPSTTGT